MMRHLSATLAALLMGVATVFAQKITVTGVVTERETGETCIAANVVLLNPKDSTQVTGINTDGEGRFTLPEVKRGEYILRISYVGYRTHYQNLTLERKPVSVDLGTIQLVEDSKLLRETVVSHNVAQVEQREDTFVYNAAAYRVPPGSTLETLVKKLPGADVDSEGKITVNGKEVKKILVKGKEFFSSDPQTAMKNISVDMVDRIKAYDKQSDYSRMTGIDDGEEETVLDLTVKKGMDHGWKLDVEGAGGLGLYDNSDNLLERIARYAGRANLQMFTDNTQVTVFASSNNTNDAGGMGGGMGGRFGQGNSGIRTSHEAGASFTWYTADKKDSDAGYMEVGGSARFKGSSTETESKTNSENFLSTGGSMFSNSRNMGKPWQWEFNTEYRLEWQIDSLTKLMVRPSYSYSRNHGESTSQSVTFSEDPYEGWSDPLRQYLDGTRDSIITNTQQRMTMSDSYTSNFNARMQLNRRLGKAGRNITFDGNAGYSHTGSESWNKNDVRYYQGRRDTLIQNKYNHNPSTSWNVRGRLSYTEPITQNLNLQMSYALQYRFSDSDRSQYERDSLVQHVMRTQGITDRNEADRQVAEWALGVSPLCNDLYEQWAKDWENSQYATYREWNHDASLMLRFTKGDVRLNAGVSFQPQTTHMDYKKHELDTTVTRHVFNWAPRVMFRWKISKTSQLTLRYNGRMTQPSMTNLLDIYDTSDPLRVTRGNPALDPSFTHTANLFYNNFIVDRQMGWMAHLNYSNTMNAISNATVYDTKTGAYYSRPMNIDGNWSTRLFAGFNTALNASKSLNMHMFGNLSYSENVGYEMTSTDQIVAGMSMDEIFGITSLRHAKTKSLGSGGRLNMTYRNDWLEVGPQGSVQYSRSRNSQQLRGDMDTWEFGYGGNLQLTAPWNMTFTTDITQQGRRGYSDASMNTNELVWNMQFSQTLLRNSLILSLRAYDVLHQRSAISRALSANGRSDSWNKAINTYVMLSVTYRLNRLGKHSSKAETQFDPSMPPPPPGTGDARPSGPPPGGGRPGGGPGRF